MAQLFKLEVHLDGVLADVDLRIPQRQAAAVDLGVLNWEIAPPTALFVTSDGFRSFSRHPQSTPLYLPPSSRLRIDAETKFDGDAPTLIVAAYPADGVPVQARMRLRRTGSIHIDTPPSTMALPTRIGLRLSGKGRLLALKLKLSAAPARSRAQPLHRGEASGTTSIGVGPQGCFRTFSPFYGPAGYMAYGARHHRHYDGREPEWYASFLGNNVKPGDKVLDLGAGLGLMLEAIKRRGASEVSGLERDPVYSEEARRHGRAVRQHDLNDPMPFLESGSVDLITAYQMLDYLDEIALQSTFRESSRVLRKGGCLLLAMRLDGRVSGDETRYAPYPPEKLRAWLEEAGFRIERFTVKNRTLWTRAHRSHDVLTWPVVGTASGGTVRPFEDHRWCMQRELGAWDDRGDRDFTLVTSPEKRPIRIDGKLQAIYTGYRQQGDAVSRAIMLAESANGREWTRRSPNPVLSPSMDTLEAGGIAAGSIIESNWAGGRFALFYSCRGADGAWPGVRIAFSDNLLTWKRSEDWIIRRDQFASLRHLALADVLRTSQGQWLMHLEGWLEGSGWAIYQARSPDGLNWTPLREHPVLSPSRLPWAPQHAANPKCFEEEPGKFLLGFNAARADLRFRLAMAQSADGTSWQPLNPQPLLSPGVDAYRVESLFATPEQWNADGRIYYFSASTKSSDQSSRSMTAVRSKNRAFLGTPWRVDEPSCFIVDPLSNLLTVEAPSPELSASAQREIPTHSDLRVTLRMHGSPDLDEHAGLALMLDGHAFIRINPSGTVWVQGRKIFTSPGHSSQVGVSLVLAGRFAGRPEAIIRIWLDGNDSLWHQAALPATATTEIGLFTGNRKKPFSVEFLEVWAPRIPAVAGPGNARVVEPASSLMQSLSEQGISQALLVPAGWQRDRDTFDALSDFGRKNPDRFANLLRVPPFLNAPHLTEYQLNQLESLWHDGRLQGLALESREGWPGAEVLDWLDERALLLMVEARDTVDLRRIRDEAVARKNLAILVPSIRRMIDPETEEAACALVAERPNVHLVSDLGTPEARSAALLTPAQVLLAANPSTGQYATAIRELDGLGVAKPAHDAIRGGNLRFLLDRARQRRRALLLDGSLLRFPPLPQSPSDVSAQGFEIKLAGELSEKESGVAKNFWANYGVREWYAAPKPWSLHMADIVKDLGASSAMEFGCNIGRNIAAIGSAHPTCKLTGFDINPEAVRAGLARQPGLDLRVGDERAVAACGPNAFDLVFTVSVLDHVVEVREILSVLLAAARRFAVFFEVCLPVDGKVVRHFDHSERCVRESTGASYSWDLRPLLASHPRVQRLDTRPLYLHERSLGPYYRSYIAFLR